MRVLIYGGRDYDNQARMNEVMDRLHAEHKFTLVINGGQSTRDLQQRRLFGADWQAVVWAQSRGIPIRYFYANWSLFGRLAGPYRNERMAVVGKPEIGVQFPGGKGTRDMRRRLDRDGVPVVEVLPE